VETTRRALVVGNSDGIGLALTRRLLDEGWTVIGVSRSASPIASPSYRHEVLDVAAPGYASSALALVEETGPVDICVYCAGIGDLFSDAALARDAEVVRVNFVGAVDTAAAVLPAMLAAKRGHFVALSSIGDAANAAAPSYGGSKAGLSAWLGGLALAVRSRGVRITNVRLGFVDTKMAKSKVRPFMMTVDRAVDVIMASLRKRPARVSYPIVAQLLVTLLAWLTAFRLWFA
jgi:NAD(P)-dependent dehydrogenase (short-subunit alcohol dehydrogenase family)